MRITDLLKKESIALGAAAATKDEAFDKLISLMDASGNLSDKDEYKKGIYAREAQGPTAIGEGICIPHAKNAAVKTPGLASMTVPAGVDCQALDGEVSNVFFMIAAPAAGSDVHLEVLSRLSVLLMDAAFRKNLLAAKTAEEYLAIIDAKETEKFPEEVKEEVPVKKEGYRILAVTACPTGIAHTFMAAEALENAGAKLGYALKAETNGSGGVKNRLTKEEIENCDGIIIAADKQVEMARFDGKPVIQVKVADGIHKAEELVTKVMNGKAPIYHHTGEVAAVMMGGMIPPIGIALASLIFKNKFTKKDREGAAVNFIMGLSFITEGAIPYAAGDPLHVIPSCMIGSAVGGALSMIFGCTLMAPHGGIWVVSVIGNPFGYLAALVIGSFVTAGLLGVLRKPVAE